MYGKKILEKKHGVSKLRFHAAFQHFIDADGGLLGNRIKITENEFTGPT